VDVVLKAESKIGERVPGLVNNQHDWATFLHLLMPDKKPVSTLGFPLHIPHILMLAKGGRVREWYRSTKHGEIERRRDMELHVFGENLQALMGGAQHTVIRRHPYHNEVVPADKALKELQGSRDGETCFCVQGKSDDHFGLRFVSTYSAADAAVSCIGFKTTSSSDGQQHQHQGTVPKQVRRLLKGQMLLLAEALQHNILKQFQKHAKQFGLHKYAVSLPSGASGTERHGREQRGVAERGDGGDFSVGLQLLSLEWILEHGPPTSQKRANKRASKTKNEASRNLSLRLADIRSMHIRGVQYVLCDGVALPSTAPAHFPPGSSSGYGVRRSASPTRTVSSIGGRQVLRQQGKQGKQDELNKLESTTRDEMSDGMLMEPLLLQPHPSILEQEHYGRPSVPRMMSGAITSGITANGITANGITANGSSTAMNGIDLDVNQDDFDPALPRTSQQSQMQLDRGRAQSLLLMRIAMNFLVSELQAMRIMLEAKHLLAMKEVELEGELVATQAELVLVQEELESRKFITSSANARAAMAEESLAEMRCVLEQLRQENATLQIKQREMRAEAKVRDTELKRARQDAAEARDILALSDSSLRAQKEAATARGVEAAEAEAERRALQDALERSEHQRREDEFENRRVQKSLHKRLSQMAEQLATVDAELATESTELSVQRVEASQLRMEVYTSREAADDARRNETIAMEAQQLAERKVSELRRQMREQRESSRKAIEEAEGNQQALVLAESMRQKLMSRMLQVGWQLARLERAMDFRCCAPPSPRLRLDVQDLLASTQKAHHYEECSTPKARTDGRLDVRQEGNKVTYMQEGKVLYTSSHGVDHQGTEDAGFKGFAPTDISSDSTLNSSKQSSGSNRHHMGCDTCAIDSSVNKKVYGKPKQRQRKRKKAAKAGDEVWATVLEEELLQRMLAWDWSDHITVTGYMNAGEKRTEGKNIQGGGIGSEGPGAPTKNLSLLRSIFECYCRIPVRDWQYEGSKQASQHVQHYRRMLLPHARLYDVELAAVQSVESTDTREGRAPSTGAARTRRKKGAGLAEPHPHNPKDLEDFVFGGAGDGSSHVSSGGMSLGQVFLFLEQSGLVVAPLEPQTKGHAEADKDSETLLSEWEIVDAFEISSQSRWTKKVQSRVLRIDHRDTIRASSGGGVGGGGMAITPRLLSFSEFVSMVVRLSHALYSDMNIADTNTIRVYAFGPAAGKTAGNFARDGLNRPASSERAADVRKKELLKVLVQIPGDADDCDPWDDSGITTSTGFNPMTGKLTLAPTEKPLEEEVHDEFAHEISLFQEEGPEVSQPAFLAEMACKLLLRIAHSELMWQQVRFVANRYF
jgi:hypothetical protein